MKSSAEFKSLSVNEKLRSLLRIEHMCTTPYRYALNAAHSAFLALHFERSCHHTEKHMNLLLDIMGKNPR